MILSAHTGTVATIAREFPVLGLGLTVHRNSRMQPLEFRTKPFLVELYADFRKWEQVVFCKATQTGISELLIQGMLDAAGWRGRTCAYVLPTFTVRNSYVQRRINPPLTTIAAYRDRCPGGAIGEEVKAGAGNLSLKRFGRGTILFLGSETPNNFVEFSADLLIVDEFEECNEANVAMAVNRLRESPYPQTIYCGNPRLPRTGIDSEFSASDRRHWFMRCGHCGERQNLDWFLHFIDREDSGRWVPRDKKAWLAGDELRPICQRCGKPFEREAKGGLWVPAQRHERRGYSMSRLDVLDESTRALFAEWGKAQSSPERVRVFHNGALGKAYEQGGSRLTITDLRRASDGQPVLDPNGGESYEEHVVTAGIDVGAVCHITVSIVERDAEDEPIRRARLITATSSFEEIAAILKRYRVQLAVIDAGPEYHKARELRDQFVEEGGCTVWLCQFHRTPQVGSQKYGMRLDYQSQVVQVDRTAVFDVSHADILQGRRLFPTDAFGVPDWAEQMTVPVRVVDEEKSVAIWTKGSDHYRLSDVYDRVAIDLLESGGTYTSS